MENENEKQEIPEWFNTHPLAAAYKQQKAAETLKQRQTVAEKLESILAEIRAGHPEAEAALCSVLEDLKAAEKQVTALRAEAGQAYRDLQILKANAAHRQDILEAQLLGNYDSRIDEALDFFRNKIDELRRPGKISTRPMGAERNLFTMTKRIRIESNHNAVAEAMAYCRNAVTRLESLKLIPEFPADEIEGLKEGIPSIDRYQEFEGERSLPRDAPITAGAPSDYMLGKLYERADKALRQRRV